MMQQQLLEQQQRSNLSMQSPPEIPDDPSSLSATLDQMKRQFRTHRTKDLAFRKEALRTLLRGYEAMEDQISDSLNKDLGVSKIIVNITTHGCVKYQFHDVFDSLDKWVAPQSLPTPIGVGRGTSSVKYEPLGVVLVIGAWNVPIITVIPAVISAIAAGNCVVIKPSQLAPYSSKVMKKLFDQYMDPQFYRVIEGKVEVAKAISKLPFDSICFTGSTQTGRLVGIEAAKNLTPCILQLGGKCPVIVDQTADIPHACYKILFGKYFNCGQVCIGTDHVYVHESIREKFKAELLIRMNQFYGNGQNLYQNAGYSRIINEFHTKRIEGYLLDNHGGTVIYGGKVDKEKRFIEPTIVESPSSDSLMMKEEIFGPILPILSYSKLETIIEEINSRPKPLVVYLFSENKKNIQLVEERTSSGAFVVNEVTAQNYNVHLPFGGVGQSGYGRYHGIAGFKAFSNEKSICMIKASLMYPNKERFPPYTQDKIKSLNRLMRFGEITDSQINKFCLIFAVLVVLIAVGGVLLRIYA